MSGQHPEGTPPEVPEQFADAYRRAYEEALAAGEPPETQPPPASDPDTSEGRPPRSHAAEGSAWPVWLLPLVIALVALVLIGSAYLVGRLVSGDDESDAAPAASASSSEPADATPTPSEQPTEKKRQPWQGKVEPVSGIEARVDCVAEDGVDSSGYRVRYLPANMVDGDETTAWRCKGEAKGETLTFSVPSGTRIGEVGLIPGYAKTDSKSGADRYAENNRITRVRWTFADGSSVVQKLSGSADERSMRTLRVPPVAGERVELEILDMVRGERNTTMISEVRLASALR